MEFLVYTGPAETVSAGTANSSIGNGVATSYPFQGKMDEIRIWNRQLCAGEILNNMNCETPGVITGLAVNYHLNQGTSGVANAGLTIATDASGNAANGNSYKLCVDGCNIKLDSSRKCDCRFQIVLLT